MTANVSEVKPEKHARADEDYKHVLAKRKRIGKGPDFLADERQEQDDREKDDSF